MKPFHSNAALQQLFFSAWLVTSGFAAERPAFEVSGRIETTVFPLEGAGTGATNSKAFSVTSAGQNLFIRRTATRRVASGPHQSERQGASPPRLTTDL